MLLLSIINHQGKHAVEILQAICSNLVIGHYNSLGIGISFAFKLQLLSYIQVIINFTVEDNGKMLVMHGLVTTCNINNGQAVVVKADIIFVKCLLVIWPP